MMVIVPRIAVVSCFSTTPFIYGIQHEDNLRAGLLLSDPAETIQAFSEHKADIALIPAAAMPSLTDARIVTEYCVGGVPASKEALLASDDALVGAWKPFGKLPCAFAVWAAHADTDPDAVETLQHALTYGLEHGYPRRFSNRLSRPIPGAPTRNSHISTTSSTIRKTKR